MKNRDLGFYVLTAGFLYASYTVTNSPASFDSKVIQLAIISGISFYIDNRGDTHYTIIDLKEDLNI